jgi:hypothetical protein
MSPFIVIVIILNINQHILAIILSVAAVIPIFAFIIGLVWNVKSKFGIAEEYKMALLAIILTFGIRLSLHFTVLADSYYRLLIDFVCRAAITSAYFL